MSDIAQAIATLEVAKDYFDAAMLNIKEESPDVRTKQTENITTIQQKIGNAGLRASHSINGLHAVRAASKLRKEQQELSASLEGMAVYDEVYTIIDTAITKLSELSGKVRSAHEKSETMRGTASEGQSQAEAYSEQI